MWKIFFEYSDGSKCTLTGKHKDIPLRLAEKYHNQYGIHAAKSVYQQYPKKDYKPVKLSEKINELKNWDIQQPGGRGISYDMFNLWKETEQSEKP